MKMNEKHIPIVLTAALAVTACAVNAVFAVLLIVQSDLPSYDELFEMFDEATSKVPDDVLGGGYIDEAESVVVVHVTDIDRVERVAGVTYNVVGKSIDELEAVKKVIEKYMAEYSISTLGVDRRSNSINIGLLYENADKAEAVRSFAEQYIDADYVNITVMPKGTSIRIT